MDIRIRPAHLDDTAALASLLRSIGSLKYVDAAADNELQQWVSTQLECCLAERSHSVHVAISGDDLVGYVSVHWLPYLLLPGPEGYVSELFVRPESRGRTIGTRLLDAALSEARSRGCTRMQLVNPRQRESYERGFYEKRGWQERPDRANFQLDLTS